jgi:ATP/maltotriose-dependent transcriptional regulator MalT
MDVNYQSATWLGWVNALPDVLIRARPVLSVGYAWALLDGGELEASEAHLHDAERWLDTPTDKMVVVDKEQFRSLPASIATARAYRSLALGDVPGTIQYARRALDLTPEGDQIRRIQGTALLGLAQYASGDLEAACQSYTEFQASLHQSGDIATATGIAFILANIKLAQGRLREAFNTYQQAMQLATSQGEALPVGTADLYRGLGELCCEKGDLKAAADYLLTAKKLGEQVTLTDWQHRLYVAEARMQEAQGNLDEALHLLDEAERRYVRSPLLNVRPIAALRARVWIRQGKLAEALDWVRDQDLHSEDGISYLREFDYITLARLLIARYQNDRAENTFQEAMRLLERLLKAAEDGGRMGSLIEILILQSLLHQAQGNITLALDPLRRALAQAEPEGYVQLFVSEGHPMAELLKRLKDARYSAEYGHKLLAAIGKQPDFQSSAQNTPHPSLRPIVEPLSGRELEVLRLLRTELSGPEIARELVVSLNTLRTHNKNIFSKLGVNNRRAAVRRAGELGLL